MYVGRCCVIQFEWDSRKNTANIRKHGISFEDAQSAFYDEYARIIPDPEHSADEERFVLLGMTAHAQIVIVCHCYRENERVIRIISARRADRHEEKGYVEFLS